MVEEKRCFIGSCAARLHNAGFDVRHSPDGALLVRVPTWDAWVLPGFSFDLMRLEKDERGKARVRFEYFTQAQIALHLVLGLLPLAQAFSVGFSPMGFLLDFAICQGIGALVVLGSFEIAAARVSRVAGLERG